jgi:hypothetical protein
MALNRLQNVLINSHIGPRSKVHLRLGVGLCGGEAARVRIYSDEGVGL